MEPPRGFGVLWDDCNRSLATFEEAIRMSVWHGPGKTQRHAPAHPFSLQEVAIFAAGMLAAVMVGIAASGVLPTI
jgi:hypothetical protein